MPNQGCDEADDVNKDMRRLLVLAVLSSWFFSVTAQNIKVSKFGLLEKDLTANTLSTQKLDQNGEKAALIKIQAPEQGFTFDGGSLGIVSREDHNGEIWLYVPRKSKKLTIQHKDYNVLREYYYPVPIEGARTYEMYIDIGIGRYVTLTSQIANSTIYVDGANFGVSPVTKYLTYGRHVVRAIKDRYEGEQVLMVTTDDVDEVRIFNIGQRDMSDHFGDVAVEVDNKADIFFENRLVGTGSWKTQLREGSYVVETRKADCDPVKTSFTVIAQRQNNVKANAPVPHKGWLHVYTRPRNVKTTPFDVNEALSLPVGTYQLEFSRSGFVTQNKEYTVRRNETTQDTITLQRITYVKPLAFYFGGAVTVRSLMGISGMIGAVYQRHDIQVSYTFGLSESDVVYWNGDMNTGTKYKMQSLGIKYGYLFPLMRQFAITPQVGYYYNFLSANAAVSGNTIYGDNASSNALSIGAKLVFAPIQHLYLFVAPEYMFALSKDNNFKTITDSSNFSGDGFAVHAGILVNF